ncbi:MAG: dihydrofolate reductase [Halobacteriales archaeon]|nr:dihydrofolate reductase [Halobacteriales archaeon]
MEAQVIHIVAMAHGRVIGNAGRLPWRIPEDMRRFRETTTGHPVVMGRKTYDALGKPLAARTNVVVTRQRGLPVPPGVLVAASPDEAVRDAARLDRKVFVIGGAEVYAATLPEATDVLATFVDLRVPGDARYPRLDAAWHVAAREDFVSAPVAPRGDALRASFVRLTRGARDDGCALCHARAGKDEDWLSGLLAALAA